MVRVLPFLFIPLKTMKAKSDSPIGTSIVDEFACDSYDSYDCAYECVYDYVYDENAYVCHRPLVLSVAVSDLQGLVLVLL
jgi:hypothetical protein